MKNNEEKNKIKENLKDIKKDLTKKNKVLLIHDNVNLTRDIMYTDGEIKLINEYYEQTNNECNKLSSEIYKKYYYLYEVSNANFIVIVEYSNILQGNYGMVSEDYISNLLIHVSNEKINNKTLKLIKSSLLDANNLFLLNRDIKKFTKRAEKNIEFKTNKNVKKLVFCNK